MKTRGATTSTDLLTRAIEESLENAFGSPVIKLLRTPSIYRSSFALEEIVVEFVSGEKRSFILKHTGRGALHVDALNAKPDFLLDPLREAIVYQQILSHEVHGTAACHAVIRHDASGESALLLEKVSGEELYQVGELEIWEEVARWLARFHRSFADNDGRFLPKFAQHLIQYDAPYYDQWLQRALYLARHDARVSNFLNWLAPRYPRVTDALESLPRTFIHGELYASNVLVVRGNRLRICPIDWEMAGCGLGMLDLAALVSGRWTSEQRRKLFLAYAHELAGAEQGLMWSALQCCRLLQCIQWMGWADAWKPPRDHRQDWLQTAIDLSEELRL